MRSIYFFLIGVLATLALQAAIAQNQGWGAVRINHVGISVPDIEEAVTYYTEVMGFQEAFRGTRDNGEVSLVYLQVSENTFLEIGGNNAQRQTSLTHFGVHVEDIDESIEFFRGQGLEVADARLSSNSKAYITNVIDPDGIRMELAELNEDSLVTKAMNAWSD